MASELLRPSVVIFLDQMRRDENRNLRIEEVRVKQGSSLDGHKVESLRLQRVRHGAAPPRLRSRDGGYVFSPPAATAVNGGCHLIVMGDPASVSHLQAAGATSARG